MSEPLRAPALTGYLRETLPPGERVLYRTRRHWATISSVPVVLLLAALLFFPVAWQLAVLLMFCAGAAGIVAYLSYASAEFGLTDKRVLAKTGWLHRRSHEMLLSKVASIHVDQGLVGRLLGFGTLVIVGTGGSPETLPGIEAPFEFRRRVHAQIAESTEGR